MDADSSRWHEITPSSFVHEQAALRYVRDLLPNRSPYEAWSNFTFVSDQGHIREVDLLVLAPTGLFLIEIKNFRGRLGNHGSTWTLTNDRSRTFDNPLPLADQKAKELKALLARAASKDRLVRIPFLRGCVFLAEPQMQSELDEGQRAHLYVPDVGRSASLLARVGADLLLAPVTHAPPEPDFVRALPRLLTKVGIHRTRRSVTVGPWQIDPTPYDSGPTWQDHHATREDLDHYSRVRLYLYERQADAEARTSVRNAAHREYLATRGIEHPGLLVPRELLDHELGPALVIEQRRDAVRLDHYLVSDGAALDLPARLSLIRQLAEAVGYAHDRRLIHRALSPRAIIVEPGPGGWASPRLRVGEWQSAARGLSSSTTEHRVAPTKHTGRHVEAAAAPYLAPEFIRDADGTVAIDVFGLGATSYLVLTGQAPAGDRADLADRLARDGGLSPSAIADGVPPDLDALIALSTAPRVKDRVPDVERFLELLDDALARTRPAEEPGNDPWEAQSGTELPDGYIVRRVLGTGASARAFLVERDHMTSVLKVGRSVQAEERLGDEAAALEGLKNDHLVVLKRGVFSLGPRYAIEIDHAGDQTLGQLLRDEGAQLPDQLQRFGSQLLEAVNYLHSHHTFHRDIKPDNLGVRRHPKRGPDLILFDFSLAGASATDVAVGTNGYRDPFLGSDRRPTYDVPAELYSAAVTLHEMASLELPTWGDDGTDARFVDDVTIASDLFEAGPREGLAVFFRTALHRDADQRFASAAAMRKAWDRVFAAMDEQGPARTAHSYSDDPQELREEAAAAATTATALDAAGLSLRAVAVAQRLGASTVGELVEVPTRLLWRARGLSRATRLELVNRASTWRRTLPLSESKSPRAMGEPGLPASTGLDTLAVGLLPKASAKGADQRAIMHTLLGLPDERGVLPDIRWPSLAEVAEQHGLTRARLGQLAQKCRLVWLTDPAIGLLREEVSAILQGLVRVATADEIVQQLLLSRGCDLEDDPRRRQACGYAALRAVVESDAIADQPLFATRRHHKQIVVALQVRDDEPFDTPNDAELLDMAIGLADEAHQLAASDPLPTPVAVVRTLDAVARRHDLVPGEGRLVTLAAAASGDVLTNARLELYPADLDLVRALRLSQVGAGVPPEGLTSKALSQRLAARFPGLAALPDGPDLERLLRDAGFELRWNGDRLAPPRASTISSSWRPSTRGGPLSTKPPTIGGGADARLEYVLRQGGVRVITVRRSRLVPTCEHLAELTGHGVVDASSAFVHALRSVARDREIVDFGVVLRADAPDAPQRDRFNLQVVVADSWSQLEAAWAEHDVLILDGLTPFGRYDDGMAVLDRLLDAARRGAASGPRVVVVLCATQDEQEPPTIGTRAVGLVTAEEWVVAPASWATTSRPA